MGEQEDGTARHCRDRATSVDWAGLPVTAKVQEVTLGGSEQ